MDSRHITDGPQLLAELARSGSQNRQEASAVVSPGSGAVAWAARIKSLISHNRYSVRVVVLGEPGTVPAEIGEAMEAVNLAESFLNPGTFPTGRYVLLCRAGETNVFHAVP
jgi:hypothetical protein